MLSTLNTGQPLVAQVEAYLRNTLGVDIPIRPFIRAKSLPYGLQDTFDIHEFQLHGQDILLVSARKPSRPQLWTLRPQLDQLSALADRPAVFAVGALASYERRQLIAHKIPFVVPGNQLYLPDLGIDLREYFRRPIEEVAAFAPATQALFIAALLRKQWYGAWQPAVLNRELGYTAMTLTRAVRELTAAGLITTTRAGKQRQLQVNQSPAQAWERAAPYLRTPLRAASWVDGQRISRYHPPLAGHSALAFYSMLSEPQHSIQAGTLAQWKQALKDGILSELVPAARAVQWQIWSYSPRLVNGSPAVDPLSLSLSLKEETDDRVLQALDQLRENFPW